MDLNKDNKNVYTVDAESYSEYMHENEIKPTSFLNSFIKILLVILLVVVGYFFYRILKDDLSFSEVFNKKELISTYALISADDKTEDVKKENYVEVLAKTEVVSENHDEPVTAKEEKNEISKVVAERVEEEIRVEVVNKVESIKVQEPIKEAVEEKEVELVEVKVEKEKEPEVIEIIEVVAPKVVAPIEEIVEETVVIEPKVSRIEVVEHKVEELKEVEKKTAVEPTSSKVLSETYLDRMVKELNSI